MTGFSEAYDCNKVILGRGTAVAEYNGGKGTSID
jgi:hypothetical protein